MNGKRKERKKEWLGITQMFGRGWVGDSGWREQPVRGTESKGNTKWGTSRWLGWRWGEHQGVSKRERGCGPDDRGPVDPVKDGGVWSWVVRSFGNALSKGMIEPQIDFCKRSAVWRADSKGSDGPCKGAAVPILVAQRSCCYKWRRAYRRKIDLSGKLGWLDEGYRRRGCQGWLLGFQLL